YDVARRSAYAAAVTSGQQATGELLLRLEASPDLSAEETVLAAVFSGAEVDTAAVPAAVAHRPRLGARAADPRHRDAVRPGGEAGLGGDVNRRARIDVPSDQEWETGLHAAAGNGDAATVELLLELGADPTRTDCRFEATPAQWAEHFGHTELARGLSARSG